jgi:hypothetical protein
MANVILLNAHLPSQNKILSWFIPALRSHTFAQQHSFRAFSLNPYNLLLHCLSTFGFSDSYVNWYRSFLPERQFLVLISGIPISCFEVHSDVARRNIIGPFLLNIVTYETSLSTEYILLPLMTIFLLLNYQMSVLCNVLYCKLTLIPHEVVALITSRNWGLIELELLLSEEILTPWFTIINSVNFKVLVWTILTTCEQLLIRNYILIITMITYFQRLAISWRFNFIIILFLLA